MSVASDSKVINSITFPNKRQQKFLKFFQLLFQDDYADDGESL